MMNKEVSRDEILAEIVRTMSETFEMEAGEITPSPGSSRTSISTASTPSTWP